MLKFNACGGSPRMTMFDGFRPEYSPFRSSLYVRISDAYRTYIQSMFEHPFTPPHQFVFDENIQIGCAEIRKAENGELIGVIENLAIPSGAANWEVTNA